MDAGRLPMEGVVLTSDGAQEQGESSGKNPEDKRTTSVEHSEAAFLPFLEELDKSRDELTTWVEHSEAAFPPSNWDSIVLVPAQSPRQPVSA